MIHYNKGLRTEQELIEISKRQRDGAYAVEKLVSSHSKVTKDIAKIFLADCTDVINASPDEMPKFILIEGAPGIGKTVLAKEIAYRWAKKTLLEYVDILFLLFLRDPEILTINTDTDFITYFTRDKFTSKQIKNCITQLEGLQVAVVLDGYDEYPATLR